MEVILHVAPLAALISYLISFLLYVRLLRSRSFETPTVAKICLRFGFLFQLIFICSASFFDTDVPASRVLFGLPGTLNAIGLLLVTLYLLLQRRLKITGLGAFVALVGALLFGFSGALFHLERESSVILKIDAILLFHWTTVVTANVVFIFTFLVDLAVIAKEGGLKRRHLTVFHERLPALQVLDSLHGRLLVWGFVLMVCGVSAGALFAFQNHIPILRFDARVIGSLITLIIYGLVLSIGHFRQMRGIRAAWLGIAGFASLILSLLTVHLLGHSFHVY